MFTKCHVDTNATLRVLLLIPCYNLLIILLCVGGGVACNGVMKILQVFPFDLTNSKILSMCEISFFQQRVQTFDII